jgi:hypothetical protein
MSHCPFILDCNCCSCYWQVKQRWESVLWFSGRCVYKCGLRDFYYVIVTDVHLLHMLKYCSNS